MAGKIGSILFLAVVIFVGSLSAQTGPPPPRPIVETDLRDNTIKMRAIELERVKRDAHKVQPDRSSKEWRTKFEKTKNLFEKIQKLQDRIILAYTTKKTIDYREISRSASKITKNALSLEKELFAVEPFIKKDSKRKLPGNVRELIIELDNALGRFVSSPMFENTKIVDKDVSRSAYVDLKGVIELSRSLSKAASKF